MENEKLQMELTLAEWNVVMNAIAQRPFAEVANIITNLKSQADAYLATKQPNASVSPVTHDLEQAA